MTTISLVMRLSPHLAGCPLFAGPARQKNFAAM